jgi:hypothetical protein
MWGWSAATKEQVEEYAAAAVVRVTFDGEEIEGKQQGGIPYDDAAGQYKAVWMADIGIAPAGLHIVHYL